MTSVWCRNWKRCFSAAASRGASTGSTGGVKYKGSGKSIAKELLQELQRQVSVPKAVKTSAKSKSKVQPLPSLEELRIPELHSKSGDVLKAAASATPALIESPSEELLREDALAYNVEEECDLKKLINVKMGDFVSFQRPNKSRFSGIVSDLLDSILHIQVLTLEGFVVEIRNSHLQFHIPGFLHSGLAKSLLPPPKPIEKMDADELRGYMIILANTLNRAAKTKSWSALFELQKIYATKHLHDKQDHVIVQDLAMEVYKKATWMEKYAVFLFLVQNPLRYVPDPQLLSLTGKFTFRGLDRLTTAEEAIRMIRHREPAFKSFISTAKMIVEARRSGQPIPNHQFNETDQLFISFIKEYIFSTELRNDNPYIVWMSSILKKMDHYGDLTRQSACDFLIDLGVWPRWEDLSVYDPVVPLEGHGNQSFDEQVERVKKLGESFLTQLVDPLAEQRHDFGSLPAYAIDDANVTEVDDAISVERISGDPNSIWLHIHVADPTSLLQPTDEIARFARDRFQTIYLPQRIYPMFPEFTKQKFSLERSDRQIQVLTFSAKLDKNSGALLDLKVRPGLITNVKNLQYDQIDQHLSWDQVPKLQIRTFSYPDSSANNGAFGPTTERLEPGDIQDLLEIQQLSQKLTKSRVDNGLLVFNQRRPIISLDPFPLPPTPTRVAQPLPRMSEPRVEVKLDKAIHSPSRVMVSELMVLAGRVCASWCEERRICVLYRRQDRPNVQQELIDRTRAQVNRENGIIDLKHVAELRPYLHPARIDIQPGEHFTMGISDGYVKCTSPLRRFTDLIVHWQIQSFFLGRSQIFAEEELRQLSLQALLRERRIQHLSNRTSIFWTAELLRRYQVDIDAGLRDRDVWDAQVAYQHSESGYMAVLIKELGVYAFFGQAKDKMANLEMWQDCKVGITFSRPHILDVDVFLIEG